MLSLILTKLLWSPRDSRARRLFSTPLHLEASSASLSYAVVLMHLLQVEVVKVDASGVAAAPVVVRSCIAGIPPGYAKIEIDEIVDTIWGVDGLDT